VHESTSLSGGRVRAGIAGTVGGRTGWPHGFFGCGPPPHRHPVGRRRRTRVESALSVRMGRGGWGTGPPAACGAGPIARPGDRQLSAAGRRPLQPGVPVAARAWFCACCAGLASSLTRQSFVSCAGRADGRISDDPRPGQPCPRCVGPRRVPSARPTSSARCPRAAPRRRARPAPRGRCRARRARRPR
jgi:hypothetical protein